MTAQISDDVTNIQKLFLTMKQAIYDQSLRNQKFRKEQVRNLLRGYKELKEKFDDALRKDLGYDEFLSTMLSHSSVIDQIQFTLDNMDQWRKKISVETPISVGKAKSSIQPEPLGLILILSAWNYPIVTGLPYVASAIAAGNSVIFKPSQFAPYTSHVLKELFDNYLQPKYFRVVQGKVEVAKKFTSLPFDLIIFTGSSMTGKFVAQAASKNLVPYILELGGKCPIIVDESANLESAANRILFAKFANCGQTCVGADHVFVHKSIKNALSKLLVEKTRKSYGQNISSSTSMGKIIAPVHVKRLESLLTEEHGGKILIGGRVHHQTDFIEPTIIDSPNRNSKLMNEQIFGPILPLLQYQNLDQVIKQINSNPKPLAVYIFSENSANKQKVRKQTRSGAFVSNDCMVQNLSNYLPFGGVGNSGTGRVRGKYGFQSCSNLKSILETKADTSYPNNQRFPPYTEKSKNTLRFLLKYSSITYWKLAKGFSTFVLLIVLLFAINHMAKGEL